MTLAFYLRHHKIFELGFWIGLLLISVISNSLVVSLDLQRLGQEVDAWEPWVWEGSSNLCILLLVPMVLWTSQRFSLNLGQLDQQWQRWWQHLGIHLGFALLFSILHVSAMVAMRKLVYWSMERNYNFSPWFQEFLYELLKDSQTYAYFLIIIYTYNFILRRLQGEASLPATNDNTQEAADRFLIKKLGKEFLVKVSDIDWLEAAGNYVTLHAHGQLYPLRGTMASMEKRLQEQGFLRVHRSAIVNLERVAQIEPTENGEARVHLLNKTQVAVSRRYRQQLKERFQHDYA
jgi:hypothetical protein